MPFVRLRLDSGRQAISLVGQLIPPSPRIPGGQQDSEHIEGYRRNQAAVEAAMKRRAVGLKGLARGLGSAAESLAALCRMASELAMEFPRQDAKPANPVTVAALPGEWGFVSVVPTISASADIPAVIQQRVGRRAQAEQRILNAIAWMESIGIAQPEQPAVAFLAGYRYGGGAYNNPRGALRSKGLLEYLPGERIQFTAAGRMLAQAPDAALTTDELHQAVLARLPGPERKILQVLLDIYPETLSNQECAERAGYAPEGGAYHNPRGRLRTLGLVEYVGGGVRARDILFLP